MEGNSSVISEHNTHVDQKIVYFVQITAVSLVVIFCLLNLTIPSLQNDRLEKLWIGLLGSSIGYLLPSPNLKNRIILS